MQFEDVWTRVRVVEAEPKLDIATCSDERGVSPGVTEHRRSANANETPTRDVSPV